MPRHKPSLAIKLDDQVRHRRKDRFKSRALRHRFSMGPDQLFLGIPTGQNRHDHFRDGSDQVHLARQEGAQCTDRIKSDKAAKYAVLDHRHRKQRPDALLGQQFLFRRIVGHGPNIRDQNIVASIEGSTPVVDHIGRDVLQNILCRFDPRCAPFMGVVDEIALGPEAKHIHSVGIGQRAHARERLVDRVVDRVQR